MYTAGSSQQEWEITMTSSDHRSHPSPALPSAISMEACQQAFDAARATAPWTLAFECARLFSFGPTRMTIDGTMPDALCGTLYRIGPGCHDRGNQRYLHRFDGDGMIQSFRINRKEIIHTGKFVTTAKYRAETEAQSFLMSTFGTKHPHAPAMSENISDMNPANINILPLGEELLALWEAAQPYRVDRHTLKTKGIQQWPSLNKDIPFSAHPKIDADGRIWNFGIDIPTSILYLYELSPAGELIRFHQQPYEGLSIAHDCAITQNHLIILLPPFVFTPDLLNAGSSFAMANTWTPSLGIRVLVINKHDWSIRTHVLPTGTLYHIGNAWEDDAGVIRLSYMYTSTPRSLIAGFDVMLGRYQHQPGAQLMIATLKPDEEMATQESLGGDGEFPRVHPHDVGSRYSHVLTLNRNSSRPSNSFGYDQLRQVNVETGKDVTYSFGNDWILEEFIYVHHPANPSESWLAGTGTNIKTRQTSLFVFDSQSISDGPIASATLPYALPLGLHGEFVAASSYLTP